MTFLSTFQKHLGKMISWSLKLLLAPESNIPWDTEYVEISALPSLQLSQILITDCFGNDYIKLSKITICRVITALPSNVQSSFKGLCVCDTDLGEMLQLSVLPSCLTLPGQSCHRQKSLASMCAESLWSCSTLCHPVDYGLLGFSVRGVLQARILDCIDQYRLPHSSRGLYFLLP